MGNSIPENEANREWVPRPTLHPSKRTPRLDRIQAARKEARKAADISHEAAPQTKRDRRVDR